MASRPRRAKVALAVVALALVALGVWRGEAVWLWVMTKRIPWATTINRAGGSHQLRGWQTVKRWSPGTRHGPRIVYYVDSGYRASEATYVDGSVTTQNIWNPDGSVLYQTTYLDANGNYMRKGQKANKSPPWLWGVTDQTEPSMPAWMKDDEKWAKALEEAR